jgi:hypothetical protein
MRIQDATTGSALGERECDLRVLRDFAGRPCDRTGRQRASRVHVENAAVRLWAASSPLGEFPSFT